MLRQYHAQRRQGGDNPLGVGTVALGSIFYLQDDGTGALASAAPPSAAHPGSWRASSTASTTLPGAIPPRGTGSASMPPIVPTWPSCAPCATAAAGPSRSTSCSCTRTRASDGRITAIRHCPHYHDPCSGAPPDRAARWSAVAFGARLAPSTIHTEVRHGPLAHQGRGAHARPLPFPLVRSLGGVTCFIILPPPHAPPKPVAWPSFAAGNTRPSGYERAPTPSRLTPPKAPASCGRHMPPIVGPASASKLFRSTDGPDRLIRAVGRPPSAPHHREAEHRQLSVAQGGRLPFLAAQRQRHHPSRSGSLHRVAVGGDRQLRRLLR